jgi:hypothetical protein
MILIKAIPYLPDQILQSSIIEKFSHSNDPKFIDMNIRSMLNTLFSGKSMKEDNYYTNKLRKYNKTGQYKKSILLSFIVSSIISIPIFLKSVIKLKLKVFFRNKNFMFEVLNLKYKNINIGDCICSDFLRSNNTEGYLKNDLLLLKSWFKVIFSVNFFDYFLQYSKIYKKNPFFYMPETGYINESIRRLFLKYNIHEIRLNWINGKLQVLNKLLKGFEIERDNYAHKEFDEYDEIAANKILRQLVYRETTYPMMAGYDVDKSINLEKNIDSQKTAIIFLHCVSDLQYYFGVDCFIDLHDWLLTSITLLEKADFNIIIKAHPAYFNENFIYPGDRNYISYLSTYFNVDIKNLNRDKITKSKFSKIYFVNHEVSTIELSKCFNDFLCITHHGTVAIEAAYLNHQVIASEASPYHHNCSFVQLYTNKIEYEELINSFQFSNIELSSKQKSDLLKYIYFKSKKLNHDVLMIELMEIFNIKLSQKRKDWNSDFIIAIKKVTPESKEYFLINDYLIKLF